MKVSTTSDFPLKLEFLPLEGGLSLGFLEAD